MKFSLFERRKHRLAKLAAQLTGDDDAAIKARIERASAEELALVLESLPLERANALLAGVSSERLKAALAHLEMKRAGAQTSPDAAPGRDTPRSGAEPVCIRALDLAGRLLGD